MSRFIHALVISSILASSTSTFAAPADIRGTDNALIKITLADNGSLIGFEVCEKSVCTPIGKVDPDRKGLYLYKVVDLQAAYEREKGDWKLATVGSIGFMLGSIALCAFTGGLAAPGVALVGGFVGAAGSAKFVDISFMSPNLQRAQEYVLQPAVLKDSNVKYDGKVGVDSHIHHALESILYSQKPVDFIAY